MKNLRSLILIAFTFLIITACDKNDEVVNITESANIIQTELKAIIAENGIEKVWGLSLDRCTPGLEVFGTTDYEFDGEFIRIIERYFNLNSLVKFELEGNQMILFFG